MKYFLLAAALAGSSTWACDPVPLHTITPVAGSPRDSVKYTGTIDGDTLVATFDVRKLGVYGKEKLEQGEYPYMFDVVELFVSPSETGFPYYEFELTPLGQTFTVEIPQKGKFINGVDKGLTVSIARDDRGFLAEMKIPLRNLGWDGDVTHLRGGVFAVLGQRPKRAYWAAFLPKAKKANFHQPEYFRPIACGPT